MHLIRISSVIVADINSLLKESIENISFAHDRNGKASAASSPSPTAVRHRRLGSPAFLGSPAPHLGHAMVRSPGLGPPESHTRRASRASAAALPSLPYPRHLHGSIPSSGRAGRRLSCSAGQPVEEAVHIRPRRVPAPPLRPPLTAAVPARYRPSSVTTTVLASGKTLQDFLPMWRG